MALPSTDPAYPTSNSAANAGAGLGAAAPAQRTGYIGALMPIASLPPPADNSQPTAPAPVIDQLAAHVRSRWSVARDSRTALEERMLRCLRQRRGEYDPSIQQEINNQGGSDVYIQLSSVKCRAALSWLRDALLGTGANKPWGLSATPEPTLPPDVVQSLQNELAQQLMELMMAGGTPPDQAQLEMLAQQMQDRTMRRIKEEAELRMSRMETRIEDKLIEGGWHRAFAAFLDDLVTFPFAVLKGPVKRKCKDFAWVNGKLEVKEYVRNEWDRVDPFLFYFAPWASDVNQGFVIERHKLTRDALQALIGVEGYNDEAIRNVLNGLEGEGLKDWLWTDSAQAEAEGRNPTYAVYTKDLIDALQLWDSVQGKLLIEWGMDAKLIPDPDKSYPCEVWLIGNTVIRAMLNYDPLGRKPYYVTSYEKIPGMMVGNGVNDLVRDSQMMVNATARALANNMGISSGPQVGINVDRIPAGENITQMFPWKIWQFTNPEYSGAAQQPPIEFFQPQSNASELMTVFEKFSARADEDSMLPRYMSGESTPGAARTSSGLSMLISNAGKGIKQVISNIDHDVLIPAIERAYQDELRYNGGDPHVVGDVRSVATGANSLMVKEAEAMRTNEFLGIVLQNPTALQVVGLSGVAELLRMVASNLNGNVDKIVPDGQQMSTIEMQQQLIAQLQQQLELVAGAAQGGESGGGAAPAKKGPERLPDGAPKGGGDGNMMRNASGGNG